MFKEAGSIRGFKKGVVRAGGVVAAGMLAFTPGMAQHSFAEEAPYYLGSSQEFNDLPGENLRFTIFDGEKSYSDSMVFMGPGAEYQLGQFWRNTLGYNFPDNVADGNFFNDRSDDSLINIGFPNAMALVISQKPMLDNGIVEIDDQIDHDAKTPLAINVKAAKLQPDGNLVVLVRNPEELCDSDKQRVNNNPNPGTLIGINFARRSVNEVNKITIMRDGSCAQAIGSFVLDFLPYGDSIEGIRYGGDFIFDSPLSN